MSVKTYTISAGAPFQVLQLSNHFAIVYIGQVSDELQRAEVLLERGLEILYPIPGHDDTYLTRRRK